MNGELGIRNVEELGMRNAERGKGEELGTRSAERGEGEADWMTVRLGDVVEINPREALSLADDETVGFVPMSAVCEVRKAVVAAEIRSFGEVKRGYTPMKNGDVIVAKITPCFENGKVAMVDVAHDTAFGSTEFHVFRGTGIVDQRLIYHLLRSDFLNLKGRTQMKGAAGQKRVPTDFFRAFEFRVPRSLPSQRRLAALLDKADALRRKRQEALRLTDDFLRSTFLDLFGDPVTNPKGWETVPLSSLVPDDDVINYGVVQPGEDVEGGVPLVRAGDVESGVQDSSVLKHIAPEIDAQYRRSKLRGGELLIGCVGAIGSTMIAGQNLAGANVARAVARVRLKPEIEAEYILGLLKTPGVQAYFQNEVRQVAQPTLNIKQIRETPVLLPPRTERLRFQAICRRLTLCQQTTRTSSEAVTTLFSALQQRAFSGEM